MRLDLEDGLKKRGWQLTQNNRFYNFVHRFPEEDASGAADCFQMRTDFGMVSTSRIGLKKRGWSLSGSIFGFRFSGFGFQFAGFRFQVSGFGFGMDRFWDGFDVKDGLFESSDRDVQEYLLDGIHALPCPHQGSVGFGVQDLGLRVNMRKV